MRWIYFIEKYRTVTNVAGTVLVSWILSAIVSQFIGLLLPAPNTLGASSAAVSPSLIDDPMMGVLNEKMLSFYMPICDRNIFDSQKRTPCTEEVTDGAEGGSQTLDLNSPPQKSDLGATLLGTMVSSNQNYSFATIQPRGGKDAENYYIDQMIMNEGKVYDIQRNKVFFIRNGHKEYLEVENLPNIFMSGPGDSGPVAMKGDGVKLEGDKATVTRAKVESTLGDLNKIIQEARMVPNFKPDGGVDGFKVFAIKPGSIFEQLGLKNGDVIQRINGTEINSVEKAIPMLQMARNENSIAIDLTRNGAKKTLSIDIR